MLSRRFIQYLPACDSSKEGEICFLIENIRTKSFSNAHQCSTRAFKVPPSALRNARPIILQHFPLYRLNDEHCENTPDSMPEKVNTHSFSEHLNGLSSVQQAFVKMRERWDCLSEEASNWLLTTLNPRALFSGHTHFACQTRHQYEKCETFCPNKQSPHSACRRSGRRSRQDSDVQTETAWEYNVASLSWRNTPQPSVLLAHIQEDRVVVTTCLLPNEYTIFILYAIGLLLILVYTLRKR